MLDIALNGGEPVRKAHLSYGHQYIDDDDIQAVTEVLKGDLLICGPKTVGIGPGDEVITTPITFAASANAVLYCGGKPVFADIDPRTYTIDPACIEKCVTERTKAVIAVDFTGAACDYDAIRSVCGRHRLLLIEDAAHSIGTTYRGTPVGGIADLTTFSFHPVKTVTAGEGGAVLTKDDALAQRVKLFAKHGITRDPELLREQSNSSWYYEQQLLGYNYRMTDIQCALALSQLQKLERFAARRKELVQQYDQAFREIPEVMIQAEVEGSDTVRHLYILRLDFSRLSCGRKKFYDAMQAENIGVNVHYIPVYWFPYYQSLGYRRGLCPNAEAYYESSMTLPLFYSMSDQDQDDVIQAVKKLIGYFRK